MRISFGIDGDWLTDFIRNSVLNGERDYEWALQRMSEIVEPNGIDERQAEKMTQDIILGRSRFSGYTSNGTFSYNEIDEAPNDLFKRFCSVNEKLKDERKTRTEFGDAWYELVDLAEGNIERQDLLCNLNQQLKPSTMLQEFLERANSKDAQVREPYCFISPDGELFPVDWGEHDEWATNYIKRHGMLMDDDGFSRDYFAVDYLVHDRGWLLLHSPSHGRPKLTEGNKPMTKAQRETLYDYYMNAGRFDEANELYED